MHNRLCRNNNTAASSPTKGGQLSMQQVKQLLLIGEFEALYFHNAPVLETKTCPTTSKQMTLL
jgi:hypothetical protein